MTSVVGGGEGGGRCRGWCGGRGWDGVRGRWRGSVWGKSKEEMWEGVGGEEGVGAGDGVRGWWKMMGKGERGRRMGREEVARGRMKERDDW